LWKESDTPTHEYIRTFFLKTDMEERLERRDRKKRREKKKKASGLTHEEHGKVIKEEDTGGELTGREPVDKDELDWSPDARQQDGALYESSGPDFSDIYEDLEQLDVDLSHSSKNKNKTDNSNGNVMRLEGFEYKMLKWKRQKDGRQLDLSTTGSSRHDDERSCDDSMDEIERDITLKRKQQREQLREIEEEKRREAEAEAQIEEEGLGLDMATPHEADNVKVEKEGEEEEEEGDEGRRRRRRRSFLARNWCLSEGNLGEIRIEWGKKVEKADGSVSISGSRSVCGNMTLFEQTTLKKGKPLIIDTPSCYCQVKKGEEKEYMVVTVAPRDQCRSITFVCQDENKYKKLKRILKERV
ncbi:hypothetical protein ADUPG1_008122, partial [Aduncisulcus paluster]